MVVAFGIAALLAQVISFGVFGFLISDLIGLPAVFFPDGGWTAGQLFPHIFETVVSYWTVFLLGAIGATAAALLMISGRLRGGWFLSLCRIVGWLWMPLLPIGPVLGVFLLRARVYALRSLRA